MATSSMLAAEDRLEFRSYGKEAGYHEHGFWQIVLPFRGRMDMEIDGKGGAVLPGQGVLIPSGAGHAFEARGDNRFLVADMVSVPPSDAVRRRFERQAFFGVAPSIKALVDYRQAQSTAFGPELVGLWFTLLQNALGGVPLTEGAIALGIERAMNFMKARIAAPIGIADIVAASGLGEHQLKQGFRTLHGKSPYACLTQLRVEAAVRLVSETTLPLAEIADLTGHSDQSALTRRLRQHLGTTPAALRRLLRSQTI